MGVEVVVEVLVVVVGVGGCCDCVLALRHS